jgi:hypothetical protein
MLRFWLIVAMVVSMLAFFGGPVAFLLYAKAHGDAQWIADSNQRDPVTGLLCCGAEDCDPLPGDRVKIVPGGYFLIDSEEMIEQQRVLPSQTGDYWRCRYTFGDMEGKTRCFFAPVPGS